MHAGDVDGDGRDEVIIGSACVDDNGTGLWTTGLGHCDHCYLGDLDPKRPGLEIHYGMETRQAAHGVCLVDARTGEFIWGIDELTMHVHSSGLCSDFDALHLGMECYSGEKEYPADKPHRWLFAADGTLLATEKTLDMGWAPRAAYWDADPQRELVRGRRIFDYQGSTIEPELEGRLISFADILGDWREELIVTFPGELRIYTTTIPAVDRRVCLMQDPIYRMDVAIQAMGYTQVPTTSYCIAATVPGMKLLPPEKALKHGACLPLKIAFIASLDRSIQGKARLTADTGASLSPANLDVSVAAGKVEVKEFELSLPAAGRPFDRPRRINLTAQFEVEGRVLSDALTLKIEDVPLDIGLKIQAEDISRQGGGKVRIRDDKVCTSGKAISHWDDRGHWMEWKVSVPKRGRYRVAVRYCTPADVVRGFEMDGAKAGSSGRVVFSSTGGFGGNTNDWAHALVRDSSGRAVEWDLDAGPHTIRMTNLDGHGMNLDYLLLVPVE